MIRMYVQNYWFKIKYELIGLIELLYYYYCIISSNTNLDFSHTHSRLTALFPESIWILLKQETVSGSGISWAICKSAPYSRQITTPAPHRSVFYGPDALPAAQPTASKHWRQSVKWKLEVDANWSENCICPDARTHACTDWQPENIMPLAAAIGWVQARKEMFIWAPGCALFFIVCTALFLCRRYCCSLFAARLSRFTSACSLAVRYRSESSRRRYRKMMKKILCNVFRQVQEYY